MGDAVMGMLKQGTKAIYANGRFVAVVDGAAVFAFENRPTIDHAERRRPEVEAALAEHFGRRIPLRLAVESEVEQAGGDPPGSRRAPSDTPVAADVASGAAAAVVDDVDDEVVDPAELTDADGAPTGGVARLTEAFPGAVVIEEST